jgi:CheY-like chemotaxis protein
MTRILIADDDKDFRQDAQRMLKNGEKCKFFIASNPEDAIQHLETSQIDVAVVDLRLRGAGTHDKSGLDVAQHSDQLIPIIMVSDYGDKETMKEAVNTRRDGYPLLVRFLSKQDISNDLTLLRATVNGALKKRELWSKSERERVSPELLKHYKSDSRWARFYQGLHYFTSIAFVMLIIAASYYEHDVANLIFALIAMIAGEITNILISHRSGSIGQRADKNHSEILQATRFSQLLDACSSIADPDLQDRTKSDLIRAAGTNWLKSDFGMPALLPGGVSAKDDRDLDHASKNGLLL